MRLHIILIFCLLAFACSESPTEQSGDFTAFLVSQLHSYGTKIPQSDELPIIKASWKFKADKYGFQVLVYGHHFVEIDSLFKELYGAPWNSSEKNLDGYPQRLYRLPGIESLRHRSVQYLQTKSGVEIICLKTLDETK